jgi:hypothetical protein
MRWTQTSIADAHKRTVNSQHVTQDFPEETLFMG